MCGLPTAKTIQLSAEASEKSSLAKNKTFLFLRKKRKQKNDHRQLDEKILATVVYKSQGPGSIFLKNHLKNLHLFLLDFSILSIGFSLPKAN